MFFTQDDYKKIQQWLIKNSVKDTEFNEANIPFNGEETITIVQGNQNKKVFLKDLIAQVFNLGISDFVNITDKYDAPNISLEEAIRLIPSRARKEGQVITFLDREDHWHIYQFKGVLNQWNILDTWEDLFDWEKLIINSTLPDEEDLTKSPADENGNSYLSLKDREYNPNDFSGLGRVILRKNIVEVEDPIYGKVKNNYLYQDMFTQSNTIYEIRYDFDLNGKEITIPEGCVLDFQGGSLSNGVIIGEKTVIEASIVKIFNTDITLTGTWNIDSIYAEWFGAKPSKSPLAGKEDDSTYIQKCLDVMKNINVKTLTFLEGAYMIKQPIEVAPVHKFLLKGISPASTLYTDDNLTAFFTNSSNGYLQAKFENFTIWGNYVYNATLDYVAYADYAFYFPNGFIYSYIKSIFISYCKTAICLGETYPCQLVENDISYCDNGIHFLNGNNLRVNIRHNSIHYCKKFGVILISGSGIDICSNDFDQLGCAIYAVRVTSMDIHDCSFEATAKMTNNLICDGTTYRVNASIILNGNAGTAYENINLATAYPCTNISIKDNRISQLFSTVPVGDDKFLCDLYIHSAKNIIIENNHDSTTREGAAFLGSLASSSGAYILNATLVDNIHKDLVRFKCVDNKTQEGNFKQNFVNIVANNSGLPNGYVNLRTAPFAPVGTFTGETYKNLPVIYSNDYIYIRENSFLNPEYIEKYQGEVIEVHLWACPESGNNYFELVYNMIIGDGKAIILTNNYKYTVPVARFSFSAPIYEEPYFQAGRTELRPDMTDKGYGYKFFDTTINKQLTWNGFLWIEADGAKAGVNRKGTIYKRPLVGDIYYGFIYSLTDDFVYNTTTYHKGIYILAYGSTWSTPDGFIAEADLPSRS